MTNHNHSKPNADPLQGMTLETLLKRLLKLYGWVEMARFIDIRCFKNDPSIKSSLTFLRRTPWARAKVEEFYLQYGHQDWLESGLSDD